MRMLSLICCILIFSCSSNTCLDFEYEKFGLDITALEGRLLYTNNTLSKDTIVLTQQDVNFMRQDKEQISFASYMKCENGVSTNILYKNRVLCTYYFIRNDNGYLFGLFSNCFGVNKIEALNKIFDVDILINANDSTCFINSLKIEDGIITSFIDSSNTEWNILPN